MEQDVAKGRMVVGTDGSEQARHALRWAAREAERRRVGLDVVHAWSIPYTVYGDGGYLDPAATKEAAAVLLDEAVSWVRDLPSAPDDLRPVLVEDNAGYGLLDRAAGAELLVVGSRGHGGFVGLLLGSVSQRCVDHAPCPVAVIPSTWSADTSQRVVVGVDGSVAASDALHWAVAEAALREARLDVVHGYHYRPAVAPFGPTTSVPRSELEAWSQKLLDDVVAGVMGDARKRPTSVELIPSPSSAARALLEVADGADLLVVGSRGRGSFRNLVLGSVSQQCIHHARCPVVVVRPRPVQP